MFWTFKEEIFRDKKHESFCIYYPKQSVAKYVILGFKTNIDIKFT